MSALSDETFELAEGPVWDALRRRLLWVDIPTGTVLQGVLRGRRLTVTHRARREGTVGAVAVAADGSLLLAAQERLVVQRPDDRYVDGPRIVPAGQGRRLNDGGVDPQGRFVVGTLSTSGRSCREVLVRLEPDGSITELDTDLTLSNGVAWSCDGSRLFSVDTLRRTVFVRAYGDTCGARRVHVQLDDGFPDGISLDAADHLWVAVWGAGEVRRYDPDGRLVARLPVPAPHTSSVAFAGQDLDLLVITTATSELSPDRLAQFPGSGRLFVADVDVPGHPVALWSGPAPADPSTPS